MKRRTRGNAKRPSSGLSKNILLATVGGLVLTSMSVFALLVYTNSSPDPSSQLEIALRLLRKGDGDSSARIAMAIDPKVLKKRADISKREFLLGTSERKIAEGIVQRRIAVDHNELAVKHLTKSRDLSFPAGYEGQGNFYLGMALYDLFRWDEAESPLEIASERWPQGRADAIERLVDIDLSLENKDSDSALERIKKWRLLRRSAADEDDRSAVKEMQALYGRRDFGPAAELLSTIPAESPHRPIAQLHHGRCMQQLAKAAPEPLRTERFQDAAASFKRVIGLSCTPVTVRRQSNLELGRTLHDLGETTQAISFLSAMRLSWLYEPESLVSGLEEIDCLIDLERFSDVIDTLEHITKNFGELRWYKNDWMPISEMRKKVVASGERLIDQHAFEEAAKFADLLPPFCDKIDQLKMKSRLYELWAEDIIKLRPLDRLAVQYFRLAADAYASLTSAMMRSPLYSEQLMRAIENYRRAGAFQESNRLLDKYLQFEPRENQPKGLLCKARNHNSLNEPILAMNALNRILESNTSTSLIYDARLEAARLLAAKDDFQGAEELIVQNLYFGDLQPESPIWRDSLLDLGELLFRRGENLQSRAVSASIENPSNSFENLAVVEQSYGELIRSIARIEEGLRRFGNDPRRLNMLYKTARAYQLASVWPEFLMKENPIANEDTIAGWKSQRKELLLQSRETYRRLRQEITSSADTLKMSASAENFLRNSYFGEADLLYESGEYEEAMVAYRDAANRFINEPESLESMVQIANCQKQLGKRADSRRSLEMAKDILQRISVEKDSRFKLVTSHDRKGWEQYIAWMMSDL